MSQAPNSVLTVNSGSSSLKLALYDMGAGEKRVLTGRIERIGLHGSMFRMIDAEGQVLADEQQDLPDHDAALKKLFAWLKSYPPSQDLDAVGHRVVHGGQKYDQPHLVTPELVAALSDLVPLAPEHLPHELKAIRAIGRQFSELTQVACFDTAFHRQMPELAQLYALPRYLRRQGIVRYGFHGLSYEYIVQELARLAGDDVANGRIIIAHLGNGASMAAVRGGKSIDTTMGFTPAGGLMMGTRSGDLGPGVPLYLIEERGMRASTVGDMINEHSGLLGVSGISSDMEDLLEAEDTNAHAAEAIALFCYQARKHLGALAAVLGGLDTLVFTAGIGENAPPVRWRICQGLQFLGVELDAARNDANEAIISPPESRATVRVMKTNEELMIARHTHGLLSNRPA